MLHAAGRPWLLLLLLLPHRLGLLLLLAAVPAVLQLCNCMQAAAMTTDVRTCAPATSADATFPLARNFLTKA